MTTTQNDPERRLKGLWAAVKECWSDCPHCDNSWDHHSTWCVIAPFEKELDSALGVTPNDVLRPKREQDATTAEETGIRSAGISTEAGALTVEQVKSCMVATSATKDDAEWWQMVSDNINAALRASPKSEKK